MTELKMDALELEGSLSNHVDSDAALTQSVDLSCSDPYRLVGTLTPIMGLWSTFGEAGVSNTPTLVLQMESFLKSIQAQNYRLMTDSARFRCLELLSVGILKIIQSRSRLEALKENEMTTILSMADCCSHLLDNTEMYFQKFNFQDLHLYGLLEYMVQSVGGECEDPIRQCEDFNLTRIIIGHLSNLEVRRFIFSFIVQALRNSVLWFEKVLRESEEGCEIEILSSQDLPASTFRYFLLLEFVIMTTNDSKPWLNSKGVAETDCLYNAYTKFPFGNVAVVANSIRNCATIRCSALK